MAQAAVGSGINPIASGFPYETNGSLLDSVVESMAMMVPPLIRISPVPPSDQRIVGPTDMKLELDTWNVPLKASPYQNVPEACAGWIPIKSLFPGDPLLGVTDPPDTPDPALQLFCKVAGALKFTCVGALAGSNRSTVNELTASSVALETV